MPGSKETGPSRAPGISRTQGYPSLLNPRLAEEGSLWQTLRKEKLTMSELYRSFFGLKREPFAADLKIEELLETPATKDVRQRFTMPCAWGPSVS